MRATAAPAGIICVALLCSYKVRHRTKPKKPRKELKDSTPETGMAALDGSPSAGLFGTAVATMGSLLSWKSWRFQGSRTNEVF